jgi:hypothetical protein
VAVATGRKLIYSADLEAQIAARFRSFGREMAENNKRQAYIPEGALPLSNPVGTAPCFLCEDSSGVRAESALQICSFAGVNTYAKIGRIRCIRDFASCNGPGYRTKKDIH